MSLTAKYFFILSWLFCLYIGGILLFTKGFLLKRLVVDKNSTCHVNFTVQADQHGEEGCWMHRRFSKAVFVIIDALRFDFAVYNNSLAASDELPYQNKLKIIQELLQGKPQHARLYKFIADPPTTTMQRIKGLTTGSLPTFVDAGSNFASSVITEDNYIDQFIARNKKITFMGDDTWMGLFPGKFHKAYHFPSLNIKDLHTCDNGIIKHLVPELKQMDWDFMIAHFLGVDHCGHRYGPYHPAMAEKLTQMDGVLRAVVNNLGTDTVLFVLGDHGMTRTGDHGGDSGDEVDAALFVYSPSPITSSPLQKTYDEISQVDLVPTISLLLGTPIPMSNLGTVITDLFNHCPWWKTHDNKVKQVFHTVKALRLNAHQVNVYLEEYAKLSNEFPKKQSLEMSSLFHRLENQLQELVTKIYVHGKSEHALSSLEKLQADYLRYLSGVRNMCRAIWAKFDEVNIILGIMLLVCALILNLYCFNAVDMTGSVTSLWIGVGSSVWPVLLIGVLYYVEVTLRGLLMSLVQGGIPIAVFILFLYKVLRHDPHKATKLKSKTFRFGVSQFSLENIFASIILVLYMVSMFSNSFQVHEDAVTAFFIHSLVWIYFYRIATLRSEPRSETGQSQSQRKQKAPKFDIGRLLTSRISVLLCIALVFCINVRLAYNFRACREEQWDCEPSSFLQPLSALVGSTSKYKPLRYLFSVGFLISLPVALHYWLRHWGNLNGHAPAVLYVCYAVPLMVFSICFHWALQSASTHLIDNMPPWQINLFPQIVYFVSILSIVVILVQPLCLYVVQNRDEQDQPWAGASPETFAPAVFSHMKENWRKNVASSIIMKESGIDPNSKKKPPLVYGLATVYSSSVLIVVTVVALLLAMLVGDGLAPGITLLVASIFLFLEIHAACIFSKQRLQECEDNKFMVPWSSVVMWGLLASQFFFNTGHQTTIANIRWDAAFHGLRGDFHIQAFPAILLVLNTFASTVLHTLAIPLLLLWPVIRGQLIYLFEKDTKTGDNEVTRKGEFVLNEDSVKLRSALFRLVLAFMLFHGCKVLGTMCCAGLHRRHLMVWKIFAPRFVYEGATFLLLVPLLLFSCLLVLRIDNAIDTWVKKLETS